MRCLIAYTNAAMSVDVLRPLIHAFNLHVTYGFHIPVRYELEPTHTLGFVCLRAFSISKKKIKKYYAYTQPLLKFWFLQIALLVLWPGGNCRQPGAHFIS